MNVIECAEMLSIYPEVRIPAEYRIDKARALELCKAFDLFDRFHPSFSALASWCGFNRESIGPARVKMIEPIGSTEVFDLTVPVEHSFAADGILMHNCNLPHDATRDLVAEIYMHAWRKGCKGFTVYRDGSRTGVLVAETPKFQQYSSPKRPVELPCEIHHAQIKGETWTILVGLYEGKPYEVFGGLSKYVEIPKKYTEGVIIKHDRKTMNSIYDLKIGNDSDFVIKNVADQFDNANYSHTTRLISLALRHGAKIQYVVEQLQKEKDADMFSFTRVIARVLKRYIEDGTMSTMVKACEQCGGTKFAYQEGCPSCLSCGWQKCS